MVLIKGRSAGCKVHGEPLCLKLLSLCVHGKFAMVLESALKKYTVTKPFNHCSVDSSIFPSSTPNRIQIIVHRRHFSTACVVNSSNCCCPLYCVLCLISLVLLVSPVLSVVSQVKMSAVRKLWCFGYRQD